MILEAFTAFFVELHAQESPNSRTTPVKLDGNATRSPAFLNNAKPPVTHCAHLQRPSRFMSQRAQKAARTQSVTGNNTSTDAPSASARSGHDAVNMSHAAAAHGQGGAVGHPKWAIPHQFADWEVDHTRFQFKRMLGKGMSSAAASVQCPGISACWHTSQAASICGNAVKAMLHSS